MHSLLRVAQLVPGGQGLVGRTPAAAWRREAVCLNLLPPSLAVPVPVPQDV